VTAVYSVKHKQPMTNVKNKLEA